MMSRILVTGNLSGLGWEIYAALSERNHHQVVGYDIRVGQDVIKPKHIMDNLDILINCAGVNRIDYIDDLDEKDWDICMDVNAKGIYTMTKAYLKMLKRSKGTVVNIVSSASHVPMTASLAYNASKAAAHMMTQQMARELTRRHSICVFGISPNRLEGTQMSVEVDENVQRVRGWKDSEVVQRQKAGLLWGEETPPHLIAELLVYLLENKQRHRYLSGCVIPYGV